MNDTCKLTMLGTGNALVTKCYNTCFTIHTPQTLLMRIRINTIIMKQTFDYLENVAFAATVCDKEGIVLYQNAVAQVTAPFLMRRLKTDKSIISDLPDKIERNELAALTPEQTALYQETVNKCFVVSLMLTRRCLSSRNSAKWAICSGTSSVPLLMKNQCSIMVDAH